MKPPRGDEGPTFRTGDRVMVDDRHYADFWANGVIGTVATPPEEVQSFAPGWDGHVRMVSTVSGSSRTTGSFSTSRDWITMATARMVQQK